MKKRIENFSASLATKGFLVWRDHNGVFFVRSNEYIELAASGKTVDDALDNLELIFTA